MVARQRSLLEGGAAGLPKRLIFMYCYVHCRWQVKPTATTSASTPTPSSALTFQRLEPKS